MIHSASHVRQLSNETMIRKMGQVVFEKIAGQIDRQTAVAINTEKDRKELKRTKRDRKGPKRHQKGTKKDRKDTKKDQKDTEKDHNDTEKDTCTYLIQERRYCASNIGSTLDQS